MIDSEELDIVITETKELIKRIEDAIKQTNTGEADYE